LRLIHYLLRRRPTLHISKDFDQLHNLPFAEHAGDAKGIEVSKGRLVEQPGIHHAARRQVLDHHVDELVLMSRELSALDESIEGALGGSTVQTHQGAHEMAKSPFPTDAFNFFLGADAGLSEDALELAQIALCQGLIAAKLEDGM
jgi:hypothetical protein